MSNLSVGKGIQSIPASQIPAQWDAGWFIQFLKTWLAPADVRNATGIGVTVSGNGKDPATLTVTGASGGYTGTITLAPLTSGGNEGSLVFAKGILTSATNPT